MQQQVLESLIDTNTYVDKFNFASNLILKHSVI